MFVLIDMDDMRMIAASKKQSHMQLIRLVDFEDVNDCVCNSEVGRSWGHFTRDQMDQLYRNTSGQDASPEFGEAIKQLCAYVDTWPDYHKSEAQLEAELEAKVGGEPAPVDP